MAAKPSAALSEVGPRAPVLGWLLGPGAAARGALGAGGEPRSAGPLPAAFGGFCGGGPAEAVPWCWRP
eukprot:6149612-Alexandrium_andersonii.AAC.1